MLANSTTSALTGQKVILTGASSGIGQAIAQKLLGVGAKVALLSRQAPSLAEANHPQALAVAIDLADVTKVRAQILATVAELGGVDILINNAGSAYIGELATIELHQWQQLFDLNVTSVLQCIQGVLPAMRQQQKGTILNVASVAAKQGFPNWGAYCATKFALLGMGQSLAAEERPHGINVITICPGSVDTPLWDKLGDQVPPNFNRAAMLRPETVADSVMHLLQLPADGTVSEYTLLPSQGVF